MHRIFVSSIPFGEIDPTPRQLLSQTGWEVEYNPLGRRLTPEELAHYAAGAEAVIVSSESLEQLVRQSVQGAGKLRLISRTGIGLDSVPLALCKQENIVVHYTPDAVTSAVVEATIGVMISLTRHLPRIDKDLRAGIWRRRIGKSICASRIGIIGCGRIGSQITRLLTAFSPAEILVDDCIAERAESLQHRYAGVRRSEKNTILANCDIVSLHIPLNAENRGYIGKEELSCMGKESFLLNFARGGLIDEDALYAALYDHSIAGAALDVFEHEPYSGALKNLENVWLFSHIGSCTQKARSLMECGATEAVINFFNGRPLPSPVPPEEYGL